MADELAELFQRIRASLDQTELIRRYGDVEADRLFHKIPARSIAGGNGAGNVGHHHYDATQTLRASPYQR